MANEPRPLNEYDYQPSESFEHVSMPPTSTPHSLSRAVYERRSEYTRPHTIKIKVGSWNVAALKDAEKDIGPWFVDGRGVEENLTGLRMAENTEDEHTVDGIESVRDQEQRRTKKQSTLPLNDHSSVIGGEQVDIYALGLQEVVELSSAKEYIGRVYSDPGPALKWTKAIAAALPEGYQLVSEQQLSGLLLLIYASSRIAPTISSVSSISVGTGFLGYLGNKGAVTTRLVLGETTRLVFVNCHLASGTGSAHLERRCWDVTQILERVHFDPISRGGVLDDKHEAIGDEDFAFWFGDLNFRLGGLPGEDIRRLLMLHTKGEYDVASKTGQIMQKEIGDDDPIVIRHVDSDDDESTKSPTPPSVLSSIHHSGDTQPNDLPNPDDFIQDPHDDPGSLQATIDSLLPHDELLNVQQKKLAFHDGWREGPITFLPTYKYDVGSVGLFDSSEKKRAPSWCDRILFRTRRDKLEYDGKSQEEELARLKDEEMKARGIDHAADDEDVLFEYDPESDGVNMGDTGDYDENEDVIAEAQDVITKEGYVDTLTLNVYTSHQRVLSSDHKPLDAVFTLRYDAVVPELKSKIQQEVARELDRAENEGRPSITIVVDHSQELDDVALPESSERVAVMTKDTFALEGVEGVNFGNISYLRRKARGLTIANTGRVSATFSFVKRPTTPGESELVAPKWLSVDLIPSDLDGEAERAPHRMSETTLLPGEAVNVILEVLVDDVAFVRLLNDATMELDDVLVLRVVDGRDHFIPVRGTWLQSCFGRSVDELIRIPEGGVRALLPPRHSSGGAPVNRGQVVCWSAPRELFKLTDAVELLTERTIADRDMIENANFPINSTGWPFEQNSWTVRDTKMREMRRSYVLEALDNDKNVVESLPPEIRAVEKLETIAEVLVLFLGGISDGIITSELWDKLEGDLGARKQSLSAEEERSWVLDVLSTAPNHNISLVFLTSTLSKVAAELAPVPRPTSSTKESGSAKSSLDQRRSLSIRGSGSAIVFQHAEISKRDSMDRRWAEIFAGVVIRTPAPLRDKERRVVDERKRHIMEVFIQGDREI